MKTEDQSHNENKMGDPSHDHGKDNEQIHKKYPRKNNWIIVFLAFILVVLAILFFSFQHSYKTEISELKSDRTELNTNLVTKDSVINNYMGDMNEIETTIDSIKKKENIISAISNGFDEQRFTGDKKKKIIDDIKFMNYLLDKDKKQISNLYRELSHSGMRLKQFEERLKTLEKKIEERDSSISNLKSQLVIKNFEIAQLNQTVDVMGSHIVAQANIIENGQNELNRAYYVKGTFDELKKNGVITKSTGFLWMGGNLSVNTKSADSSYKTIDIRQTSIIQLDSKTAKFISNHPKDSYQWIKKNNKILYVQIIDPYSFWKYTHYAVLETN
jgi:uncharacterized coiled-coil protein SlyX